jgi:hypothetical protein
MRTIYIKGIKKYKDSLIKGLVKSELVEGKDFIQGLAGEDYALYWLNETLPLKEFKKAIGSKYVWKHRMRFYNTIDEMKEKNESSNELTETEKMLMNKLKYQYLWVDV